MKNQAKEYGHLATAIEKMPVKPVLNIHAHMDSYGGPMGNNTAYQKEELKRLRKEVKATSDQISNWNAEEISNRALKSLKTDLAMKKARLMECEALLEEEGGEEEGAKEEGAEGKGAVVGGPYEVKESGDRWVVKNMETGKVKGRHSSREAALKQFRLLEGIEHGWKPTGKK